MKYTFDYEITLNVKFTDEEFDLLSKAIESSEYKNETTSPGFWYGAKNMRRFGGENPSDTHISLTFRQMDMLAKCLEPLMYFEKNTKAIDLFCEIGHAMHSVNTEYEALALIKDENYR